jgi:hypothetical protein
VGIEFRGNSHSNQITGDFSIMKIAVSQNQEFRKSLAETFIKENHPNNNLEGWHYADPENGTIYFYERGQNHDMKEGLVPIELFFDPTNDYDPLVDWDIPDIDSHYRKMVAAYLEEQGEEFEENGDIPEWVDRADVVEACSYMDEFSPMIEKIEKENYDNCVQFFQDSILEEIETED